MTRYELDVTFDGEELRVNGDDILMSPAVMANLIVPRLLGEDTESLHEKYTKALEEPFAIQFWLEVDNPDEGTMRMGVSNPDGDHLVGRVTATALTFIDQNPRFASLRAQIYGEGDSE